MVAIVLTLFAQMRASPGLVEWRPTPEGRAQRRSPAAVASAGGAGAARTSRLAWFPPADPTATDATADAAPLGQTDRESGSGPVGCRSSDKAEACDRECRRLNLGPERQPTVGVRACNSPDEAVRSYHRPAIANVAKRKLAPAPAECWIVARLFRKSRARAVGVFVAAGAVSPRVDRERLSGDRGLVVVELEQVVGGHHELPFGPAGG